jgi:hypothetical protein
VPFVADALTNPGGNTFDCFPRFKWAWPPIARRSAWPFWRTAMFRVRCRAGGGRGPRSRDRQPPRSPAVLWMAWHATTGTLEPAVTLVTGFQDADGSRWGRPVDAIPGPDGALYVSDDAAGAINRLATPKS